MTTKLLRHVAVGHNKMHTPGERVTLLGRPFARGMGWDDEMLQRVRFTDGEVSNVFVKDLIEDNDSDS